MIRQFVVVIAALAAACGSKKEDGGKPAAVTSIRVAGASDLLKAFGDLGAKWKAKSNITPVFDFSSSGLLARQIKEGAPADLFASANVAYVDEVVAAGKCDGATKAMYARGRLVMWTKNGGVVPPARIEDLADPRFKSIAIASPDHAPYGKAAKQAMEKVGIWPSVEGRIKYGENISQTMQFAQTGNVEVALVALSLSIVNKDGTAVAVPPELHDPIDQALVVCGTGPQAEAAKSFAAYVASPEGRAIMMEYGFVLPGEGEPGK